LGTRQCMPAKQEQKLALYTRLPGKQSLILSFWTQLPDK